MTQEKTAATYLLHSEDGVICAYHSLEQVEKVVQQLEGLGFNVWFEEVPTNPMLVTHIASCAAQPLVLNGCAEVGVSKQVMTLGQARAMATMNELSQINVTGYGFGVERAMACMLERAGLPSRQFVAMQVAA
jgi:hypothetical protein